MEELSEINLSSVLTTKFSIRTWQKTISTSLMHFGNKFCEQVKSLAKISKCLFGEQTAQNLKRTPAQLLSSGRDSSCFEVVLQQREKYTGRGKKGLNKIPTNPGGNHNTIENQAVVERKFVFTNP